MLEMTNDRKNIIFSLFLFVLAYAILAVLASAPVTAFDTFWHLQMGRDLVEHGLSPWVDHYSITYQGEPIYPVPVMFQVLLYRFVSFFGEAAGFYYIKLFYVSLMLLALWLYFRKIHASAFIVLVFLPLMVSAVSLRILIRPEIFSNVLVVICLYLYLNAQKEFSARNLIPICLLLLFWTSYHSPVIGYIIIFGLFLEKAINKLAHKDDSLSWKSWFAWGMLIFSIGFTNINFNGHSFIGPHFIIGMFNTVNDGFGQYIQEYRGAYYSQSTNYITHISWALSLYAAIWSVIRRQYGFAFIIVLLTLLSWSMARLLAIVLLINMCVMALYFSGFVASEAYRNMGMALKRTMVAVSIMIAFASLYFLADRAIVIRELAKDPASHLQKRYPVQVANYLKNHRSGGKILNILQDGGYLASRLAPEYKIYIDGRTNILYPVEFLKHNVEIWRSKAAVEEVINRVGIDYVVNTNTPEVYNLLHKISGIRISFADDDHMLFSRAGDADFPLMSTLMAFPRCLNNSHFRDAFDAGWKGEAERAGNILTDGNYTLLAAYDFMREYFSQADRVDYLRTLEFTGAQTDAVRRLALYLAMETADKKTAVRLFSSIGVKTHHDILLFAYYLAQQGDYGDAQKLAYFFHVLEEEGTVIASYDKYGILARILRILKQHDQLELFDADYVEQLETNLNNVQYPFERELAFDFMCK